MRPSLFALVGLAVLTTSCERPKQLVDGCYYAEGTPVFKIVGNEGRVLIPGDVKTFKVERAGPYVTFAPGLLFDASEAIPLLVHSYPGAPPYAMKKGTSVPTIEMHWEAHGDEDVYLGKPC